MNLFSLQTPTIFILLTQISGTLSLASNNFIKVCQHKNCIKQFPVGNLVETFENLISTESSSQFTVESSSCLSGCGKGPNVSIEVKGYKNNNGDKVHGGVDDALAAAMLLDSECSYKCHPMLLAACNVMAQVKEFKSATKKEKFLSSVITTLSGNDELATSHALVSALLERADIRLSEINISDAIDDCNKALEIEPINGVAWRRLAEALEMKGDTLGAIDAVSNWAKVDTLLHTKACKEIERLSAKL